MRYLSKRSVTLASCIVAMGLSLTACNKHETAEEHQPTEEIAAQQSEIARANNPAPVSKEKASPVAAFAAAPAAASGTAPADTNTATAAAAPAGDAGEKLYASVCKTCHEGGLMGAPKFGDKASWQPRIAQGKETLYKHAIGGFQGKNGVMPAKGGSTASDDEVKAAVDYMVSKAS